MGLRGSDVSLPHGYRLVGRKITGDGTQSETS
jgi:hypothetical protein